jgi:hypothetical protein
MLRTILLHYCSFLTDITECKRMEAELFKATEILLAVSQNSPDLLFAKDCQC